MTTKTPTFIRLPDFTYRPHAPITLGTLLPLSRKTRLPDPSSPLNATTPISPHPDLISNITVCPFSLESSQKIDGTLGFDVQFPILTPVGAGAAYAQGRTHELDVRCERLEVSSFVPDARYYAAAVRDKDVQAYRKQAWRPTFYMVIGLAVAYDTTITDGISRFHSGKLSASVDATAFGVPLSAGPVVGAGMECGKVVGYRVQQPFLLAYQLRRLRLREDGSVKRTEGYTKHALFSDVERWNEEGEAVVEGKFTGKVQGETEDGEAEAVDEMDAFEVFWETEDVGFDILHGV